jgi:hypothetical protein
MNEVNQAKLSQPRALGCLWALALGALALAAVSLLINLVLIAALLQARNSVQATLDQAVRELDAVSGAPIRFDLAISQTVDFAGSVPFRQDMVFPFKGEIPISTTLSVPLDLGPLGSRTIDVPVNTTAAVDVQVPVHIDQVIPVKTQVPVRMTVPIEISPNQPPLRDWLGKAREWLLKLRKQL